MRTYEKIETIFNRDTTGTKKLILGDFRNETVKFLKDTEWVFTEKIDGTNIRVYWMATRWNLVAVPTTLRSPDLFLIR